MDPTATPPDVTRFFHPVLRAKKLGAGPVRVELAGRAYALFRDHTGRAAALADACPHRLAPLSAGRVRPDGRLACPYHGWHFDADGRGASPSQPSLTKCDVRALHVVEKFDYVWLAARDAPAGAFPQLGWDGYEFIGTFAQAFQAPLHVCLDNFSEDEHTPWVHTRLGWDEARAGEIEFEAHNFDDRTEVHYAAPQRPSYLTRPLGLRPGDVFHNDWVTRFDPVRTEYTLHWRDPSTGAKRPFEMRVAIFMVPVTARATMFHSFAFLRLHDEAWRPLLPIVRPLALALGWMEVRDDARFIPTVADTPFEMKGMRLGKYDKPLIHNHKLLRAIYWGGADGAPASVPQRA